MNAQGRQHYPAPTFPPPPTEEYTKDQTMTTGLPDYAYRAMYDNYQYADRNAPHPPQAGSHSNSSHRSQRSTHGSMRGRPEPDRLSRRQLEDGHYESERRTRADDRRPRRRPTSSHDSDRSSYDSRDHRHRYRDDRRRGGRSRSRRRSPERDKRDQQVQKHQHRKHEHQQQGKPEEEKKSGFGKVEQYITPFNVGILMGCMDLIGGSISLYMTNKRFSKKALAKGPSPGEPGASSSGGGAGDDAESQSATSGGADEPQQGNRSTRRSDRSRSRSRRRAGSRNRHDRRRHRSSSRSGGSRYHHGGRDGSSWYYDERDPSEYDEYESGSDSTGDRRSDRNRG